MAIKRFTIELDDSPQGGPTAIPESARPSTARDLKAHEPTQIPGKLNSEETLSPESGKATPRVIGRTSSDLIAEFVTEPRATATILMFLPFPFFAAWIKGVTNLLYPFIVGLLLNIVWFGLPWASKLFGKKGK